MFLVTNLCVSQSKIKLDQSASLKIRKQLCLCMSLHWESPHIVVFLHQSTVKLLLFAAAMHLLSTLLERCSCLPGYFELTS